MTPAETVDRLNARAREKLGGSAAQLHLHQLTDDHFEITFGLLFTLYDSRMYRLNGTLDEFLQIKLKRLAAQLAAFGEE